MASLNLYFTANILTAKSKVNLYEVPFYPNLKFQSAKINTVWTIIVVQVETQQDKIECPYVVLPYFFNYLLKSKSKSNISTEMYALVLILVLDFEFKMND